uniref:Alpha-amylase n=1 Tax=uncultured Chloroflexus sp. TaxID=214040 RepID=A0A060C8Q6_9CHLR|nr:alpha-amylase [uncultured Chloroflexus sp.]
MVTPFFKTRSYHGYDTTDYFEVDERFGTKDDLRALITALHARNMRFVLDLVVNHVSLDFPPFVRASASADAPDRAWFRFDPGYRHGYRTFFDVASMPQLELDYPRGA